MVLLRVRGGRMGRAAGRVPRRRVRPELVLVVERLARRGTAAVVRRGLAAVAAGVVLLRRRLSRRRELIPGRRRLRLRDRLGLRRRRLHTYQEGRAVAARFTAIVLCLLGDAGGRHGLSKNDPPGRAGRSADPRPARLRRRAQGGRYIVISTRRNLRTTQIRARAGEQMGQQ